MLAVPSCPLVKLDDKYYKLVDKMEALTEAPPSLINAKSLTVKGPVKFVKGVVIKGDVTFENGKQHSLCDFALLLQDMLCLRLLQMSTSKAKIILPQSQHASQCCLTAFGHLQRVRSRCLWKRRHTTTQRRSWVVLSSNSKHRPVLSLPLHNCRLSSLHVQTLQWFSGSAWMSFSSSRMHH